jgi:hypothetical protein
VSTAPSCPTALSSPLWLCAGSDPAQGSSSVAAQLGLHVSATTTAVGQTARGIDGCSSTTRCPRALTTGLTTACLVDRHLCVCQYGNSACLAAVDASVLRALTAACACADSRAKQVGDGCRRVKTDADTIGEEVTRGSLSELLVGWLV